MDVFSPGLGITRCNSEFANLGGVFSGGLPLQKWLGRSSNGQFSRLFLDIQTVFQTAAYEKESQSLAFGKLKMFPPGLDGRYHLVAHCLIACVLDFSESDGDGATERSEVGNMVQVRLVFSSIEWIRQRKRESRRASRSSGESSGNVLHSHPVGRRSELLLL